MELPFCFGNRDETMSQDHLMPTYARLPVAFERGEGVWLWDSDGKRYLDALSGIGVCNLGHAHPAVAEAICDQASRLIHTSNLYRIPLQEHLAQRLCDLSGMQRAFFANSGAEANEAAIKLARRYGHQRGIDTPTLIVCEGSFHGRTLATLTATANRKAQAGFEPLVHGFVRVPFDDLTAVENAAETHRDIVAVLVEPIQGEGGVRLPSPGYLDGLRELCNRHGWLLILDEVQTGLGRTGAWFAHQHENLLPDVLTLAKALGNGLPIGACLARGPAAEILGPGSHGSTFGGNPLVCRGALAVLDTMERQQIPAHAARMGEDLLQRLRTGLGDHPGICDIRGRGLMIAIELERPCASLVQQALEVGLLINVTAERVVRLLPPLIIDDDEIAHLSDTLIPLIRRFLDQSQ